MWVLRGLRNGVVTTRWPRRGDRYADGLRGPARVLRVLPDGAAGLPELCPTGAISYSPGEGIGLDQGRCILCGRCVAARPDAFAWSQGPAVASLARAALVTPQVGRERGGTGPGPRGPAPADPRAGPLGAHPARGRGLGRQRGVGDPRPAQPGLRRAPARRLLHRQPPARRRAAGDRGGSARDDRAAAPDLRRDAGSEGGDRGRDRRGERRTRSAPRTRRSAASARWCRWTCGCRAPRPARSSCSTRCCSGSGGCAATPGRG